MKKYIHESWLEDENIKLLLSTIEEQDRIVREEKFFPAIVKFFKKFKITCGQKKRGETCFLTIEE